METVTPSRVQEIQKQIESLKKELTAARKSEQRQVVNDYEFKRTDGSTVNLSGLFGDKDDLLVVHNMGKGCSYCTLWADGFIGHYPHYADRCGFALCSGDDWETADAFARSRNWNFPVVSGADSPFAKDMGFQSDKGDWWPGVSAFRRQPDGSIVRTSWAWFGPGDDFCPVWPMLDLLEQGDAGWEPKLSY